MTNTVYRELTRGLLGDDEAKPTFRFCAYCGTPCYGRTCAAHRDVALLEQSLTRESHEPNPASTAIGSGSSTKGE